MECGDWSLTSSTQTLDNSYSPHYGVTLVLGESTKRNSLSWTSLIHCTLLPSPRLDKFPWIKFHRIYSKVSHTFRQFRVFLQVNCQPSLLFCISWHVPETRLFVKKKNERQLFSHKPKSLRSWDKNSHPVYRPIYFIGLIIDAIKWFWQIISQSILFKVIEDYLLSLTSVIDISCLMKHAMPRRKLTRKFPNYRVWSVFGKQWHISHSPPLYSLYWLTSLGPRAVRLTSGPGLTDRSFLAIIKSNSTYTLTNSKMISARISIRLLNLDRNKIN